jgi:hypothetical protein
MKFAPSAVLAIAFVAAITVTAHSALAGESSPIFGSDGGMPFQLAVDPVSGKPLVVATKR